MSSAVFYGAGEIIANNGIKDLFARGAIRGLAGGVTSVLSGGKFGHGFAAAGVTSFAGGKIDSFYNAVSAKVIASALIGGTTSRITGGKFANGAITATFMRGYNEENHKTKSQVKAGDQSSLVDFFRSLSNKIAAFRDSVEGTLLNIGDSTSTSFERSKPTLLRISQGAAGIGEMAEAAAICVETALLGCALGGGALFMHGASNFNEEILGKGTNPMKYAYSGFGANPELGERIFYTLDAGMAAGSGYNTIVNGNPLSGPYKLHPIEAAWRLNDTN